MYNPEQKQPKSQVKQASQRVRQTVIDKTGYEPGDLLNAPMQRPELQNVRRRVSGMQLLAVLFGLIIAVIGLSELLVYFSVWGVLLIAVGAMLIIVGALARI